VYELKMEHINVLICYQVERKIIYKVNETERCHVRMDCLPTVALILGVRIKVSTLPTALPD
jgi:hypothetical protein